MANLTSVPHKGTIVPDMGTPGESDTIGSVLFGKTRRAILSLLFIHADEEFHLREIIRSADSGVGIVHRELQQLHQAGLIHRRRRGQQVYFQANRESPVFAEIKGLIVKTTGVAHVLKRALTPLAERIRVAFIYGSIARGEETSRSDVDTMVVGNVMFSEVVAAFHDAQETLRREINPTVFPIDEFASRVATEEHFLTNVMAEPKIFVIGDEYELARLAKRRITDRASV